jgi:hypothetical protein
MHEPPLQLSHIALTFLRGAARDGKLKPWNVTDRVCATVLMKQVCKSTIDERDKNLHRYYEKHTHHTIQEEQLESSEFELFLPTKSTMMMVSFIYELEH